MTTAVSFCNTIYGMVEIAAENDNLLSISFCGPGYTEGERLMSYKQVNPSLLKEISPILNGENIDIGINAFLYIDTVKLNTKTPFQLRVLLEIAKIPYGQTISYIELARRIGRPKAVRAVASACSSNPFALLIPCHRVIRANGELGGYRWGRNIKQQIINNELCNREPE